MGEVPPGDDDHGADEEGDEDEHGVDHVMVPIMMATNRTMMTIMVPIMVVMKRTMMTMMILMMAMKRRLMMMMSLILSIGLESFTPSLISFADWRHQLLRGRLSIGKDGGLVMVMVRVRVRVMVMVRVEMEIKFGWRGHF